MLRIARIGKLERHRRRVVVLLEGLVHAEALPLERVERAAKVGLPVEVFRLADSLAVLLG